MSTAAAAIPEVPATTAPVKEGVHMSFALVLVFVFRGRVYFLLVGACGVI